MQSKTYDTIKIQTRLKYNEIKIFFFGKKFKRYLQEINNLPFIAWIRVYFWEILR